jgi:rod shape-determining protein MreC
MVRLILFLKRISFFLLFVAIEAVALRYFSNSSDYNQAKVMSASHFVTGDIYTGIAAVRHFFSLGRENRQLTDEVAGLRQELQRLRQQRQQQYDTLPVDSFPGYTLASRYVFTTARVNNNSIYRSENYITLDKGLRQGVRTEMAVLSHGAIVGYVLNCSDRFSVAISILNTRFRTSGRIQGEDYFGSVFWDGQRADEVVLSEIPKYAPIAVGDTIVTTDYSSYFPPGLLIGTVRSFELVNGTYYDARVRLSADVATLNNVVLADYIDREEKQELELETVSLMAGQ